MGKSEVKRRAVFLDRDGVLNRSIVRAGRPYPPSKLAEFSLYEDVPKGCKRLKAAGFFLAVVTNQPDVGRGTQQESEVEAIHQVLRKALPLDRVEVCYHGGEEFGQACDCRKPQPGMVLRVARECALDLKASYLIGDRWRDVNCARAAGCAAIFMDHGYAEALREAPDFIVRTFTEAVDVVLREAGAQLHSPAPRARD